MIEQQAQVKACLDRKFVKTDRMSEILGLALEHEMNVMLYGPPGYGKSEMAKEVLDYFGLLPDTYIKTLSVETGVDELLGGINILLYRDKGIVRYNCDDSFMASEIVVLEEFADCPPATLAVLKDILTAKMFRNGNQQYELKTKIVIGITNHQPESVTELGDWAKAIIERFPIRGEIYWDSHKKADYLELFKKVMPEADEPVMNQLADLSEQSGIKGGYISPRVARKAIEICDAWYKEIDDEVARNNLEYLSPLNLLPEYAPIVSDMKQRIEENRKREQAESDMKMLDKSLRGTRTKFKKVSEDTSLSSAQRTLEIETVKNLLTTLMASVDKMTVPDNMVEARNKFRNKISEMFTEADSVITPLQ